jgi:hypothetical protein
MLDEMTAASPVPTSFGRQNMRKPNTQDYPTFQAGGPVDLEALARSIGVEIQTPRPWGYLATVGWLVLATLVGTILLIAVMKWLDPEAPPFKTGVADDELRLLPYAMVWAGALLAVLALAAGTTAGGEGASLPTSLLEIGSPLDAEMVVSQQAVAADGR